jgi:hypothetical protein
MIFPGLGLSAYAIDDLLLKDVLLVGIERTPERTPRSRVRTSRISDGSVQIITPMAECRNRVTQADISPAGVESAAIRSAMQLHTCMQMIDEELHHGAWCATLQGHDGQKAFGACLMKRGPHSTPQPRRPASKKITSKETQQGSLK